MKAARNGFAKITFHVS